MRPSLSCVGDGGEHRGLMGAGAYRQVKAGPAAGELCTRHHHPQDVSTEQLEAELSYTEPSDRNQVCRNTALVLAGRTDRSDGGTRWLVLSAGDVSNFSMCSVRDVDRALFGTLAQVLGGPALGARHLLQAAWVDVGWRHAASILKSPKANEEVARVYMLRVLENPVENRLVEEHRRVVARLAGAHLAPDARAYAETALKLAPEWSGTISELVEAARRL